MLRAGVFDQALQQATPETVALAVSLGWRADSSERGRDVQDGYLSDMAPD
jgi:hypothetical protein